MTRQALYWAILGAWCAFVTGCSTGVIVSTRVNTGVAVEYVRALEWERFALDKTAQAKALAIDAAARAKAQAVFDIQLAQLKADMAKSEARARLASEEMAAAYSAQILGLREQLRAAGLSERVIRPAVATR